MSVELGREEEGRHGAERVLVQMTRVLDGREVEVEEDVGDTNVESGEWR